MITRRQILALLGAAAISKSAAAQSARFPSGRTTIVVPFPAGATTDISARIYAERLSALWGQPVVVDNRGGGNGIPAAESVTHRLADEVSDHARCGMR